jgi:hypothetical protein
MFESETDDESINSFDEESNFLYEAEEPSLTKYNLVICERYNHTIHGDTVEEMNYHYLTYMRFKNINYNIIENVSFIGSNNINTLEIAECITLQSLHCIAILKTFWLKIIQRKWKNILRDRKIIIKKRCHPDSLRYREIHGRWPSECFYYPSFRGMLCNL